MSSPFANEPLLDLASPSVRERFAAALEALDARLPLDAPSLVGERAARAGAVRSVDPARPDRVVALADVADAALVDEAVTLAATAGRAWSELEAGERAQAERMEGHVLNIRRELATDLEQIETSIRRSLPPARPDDGRR